MTKNGSPQVLIAGGGIGGLAAALACVRQGVPVQLFERAAQLSEVGAGIQIGPNVTRILQAWGLGDALAQVAAFPKRLQARDARTGQVLGSLRLGERAQALYGAPYATIHRADLQAMLHTAVQAVGVDVRLGQTVQGWRETAEGLQLNTADGPSVQADALIGADGVWSAVRQQLLGDAPARFTWHLAYRALVAQADLPTHLRSDEVTVWMGPRLHVVHYPVRGGQWLNLIAIVHGDKPAQADAWDATGHAQALMQAMGAVGADLHDRLASVPAWRQWALHDRAPMAGAHEMAKGRVALLGDAAHPMRPYLAQGAGMAIEDAQVLGLCLSAEAGSVAERLQAYAGQRWARNARVQARAIRNGRIFHATGPVAWGRNVSMRLMGERVMDVPWLYGAGPVPT
ncbi:FAD-dependent oxidoreductase [Limnohabitans sp. MMS-10A-160]|uniref:FAD-dependent monooxygenase n=1 Tax=unclassified Limnohabitans TaxID=2626134 RepID=UPI000D3906E2|nr:MULTISPECIES: FAD-dependent monooxygenase [unclassified Limnohabitans]PUE21695.1 FAD-dependent oxidoreductase [Limnohabitans sp. MMS-10A-192]PUE26818.1 FAD-dependent oxidoreductase [Limnohabitans sp. MMS-10A-160]